MFIQRRALVAVLNYSKSLILVDGPPRSGLSTFALQLAKAAPKESFLIDARSTMGRNMLANPQQAFSVLQASGDGTPRASPRTIVVDNADAGTELALRSLQDVGRAQTRFILLGRGFAEDSPAARVHLRPFGLAEVGAGARTSHWLRGGFPEAHYAPSDAAAFAWLSRYADSVSEERFAAVGLPWAPGRGRNLLSMIAESQARPLNENAAARSLGLSRPTVARAVTALERAGLVRLLPTVSPPTGRRVVRSSAVYIRDSGLYHAISGTTSVEALLGSARLAASWEGYVIEELISRLPETCEVGRYTTREGTALELAILRQGRVLGAVSIRWGRSGAPSRAAVSAARELGAERRWVISPEAEEQVLENGFTTIGLVRFLELVERL